MSFIFKPRRIFDFLVAGGILLLLTNSEDNGWKLIGLGLFGFLAYVLIRFKL